MDLRVGEEVPMEEDDEFTLSRNYFLAKEGSTSRKKSARKLSDIDLVDEQVLIQLI